MSNTQLKNIYVLETKSDVGWLLLRLGLGSLLFLLLVASRTHSLKTFGNCFVSNNYAKMLWKCKVNVVFV